MAASKQVFKKMTFLINAGQAKAAPPLGPAISRCGINIMQFCKDFNAKSTGTYKEGVELRVKLTAFTDKTFEYKIFTPTTMWLIKKAAGLERAAEAPGREIAGVISLKHVYEIAKIKQQDIPMATLRGLCRNIIRTAASMGVMVVPRPEDAFKLPTTASKQQQQQRPAS